MSDPIDFALPRVDFPSETLNVTKRGDDWVLMVRSWYGGHRPDYTNVRVLTQEQAIWLVQGKHKPTERCFLVHDFMDHVRDLLARSAIDQLADLAEDTDAPQAV